MCLQADLAREREAKAAVQDASAKAVAAAKQHAADMSRDLEAVHDELEVRLLSCWRRPGWRAGIIGGRGARKMLLNAEESPLQQHG